ncbi:MAG: hypothetical protein ACO26C_05570 [Ilumatobacteraceae bacterium]
MPWCEPCGRYRAPSALREDGACPECGTVALDLRALARAGEPGSERVPWHFTLLVVLLVAYLGWRIVDLVVP